MSYEMGLETGSLDDLAAFAKDLARSARRETLGALAHDRLAENKGQSGVFDPVTPADRACEATLRRLIEERFPDHGISGEEYPDKASKSGHVWSIDPIDGTRSYMCGLPTWTTLIALLKGGKPVLGLIDAPCLGETYLGLGEEAVLIRGDEEGLIRTSGCNSLGEARFSTTDPFLFGSRGDAVQRVLESVRVSRFGHDAYAYARLAAGSIDLVIESGLKPHDYNALIPVIRGAGGYLGGWTGTDDIESGDVIAAASRNLYDEAVALLGEA